MEEIEQDYEDEGHVPEIEQKDIEENEKIKSKFHYLARPPIDPNFNSSKPLILMQTDVDYYIPKGSKDGEAVLRIFGVTKNEHSVMVHAHKFLSYFYCECPVEFDPTFENLEALSKFLSVSFICYS